MDIKVPHLAEGVQTGTVVSIRVAMGDQVAKDQTVVEIESNKAVAAINAPEAGQVTKIHVKEGDTVAVGGVLVTLGGKGAAAPSASKPVAAVPAKTSSAAPTPVTFQSQAVPSGDYHYESKSGFPPPASPSIRKMARDLGIDLTRVRGSESGGRITLADIRNYIERLQQTGVSGAAAGTPKKVSPSIDFSKWGPVQKKPLTPLRKTISEAMTDSWLSVPRVTQFDDLNIDAVTALRKKYVDAYKKEGAHLTVTSFVIKAVVKALQQIPIFNASLDEAAGEVILKQYYHIGIAVDTEHGLMVPVLRDADKKSIFQISREVSELAEKTRARKISIEEMKGGTFTISNQGGIGGRHFTPIVNKPEAAILGIGRSFETPVVTDGKITTQLVMPIGLSYDHRLIDGGQAARFVVVLAEALKSFTDADVALGKSSDSTKSDSHLKKIKAGKK